ncbi:MAG TPA: MotA/TolQ/ExbB proton channel family protein [Fibrobacteria bacterium]|nr:MotA/TolQ/ExbB proton channel family protein [Fibrobacteria bacterium]
MKPLHAGRTLILGLALIASGYVESRGAPRRREEQKVQDDLDKARQELELYRKQLEDVRVKRWQDKRNAVAAQEAFSDAWNEIKADIDRLGQMKDQKEESLLRLQNQESEKRREVEEQEGRLKQFGLQVRDKLGELGSEWANGFPYRSAEKIGKLSAAKKAMEREDPAGARALDRLFGLAYEDFLDGETRGITRDKLAVKGLAAAAAAKPGEEVAKAPLDMASQAKIAAGYTVRMGQAYQAFVSTESGDVAILGKTGRLDGKTWEWIEDLPGNVRAGLRQAVMGLVSSDAPGVDMVLLPMDVLLTKATGEGFTTQARGTFWKAVEKEFDGGGWVMFPILALALAGILIVLYKVIVFLRRDQSSRRLAARVQALAEAERIPEAIALCKKHPGSVGRVLLSILENADGSREDAESRAHEVMLHESPALEKLITTMNILAAASPLVGLLGTVTGMVRLFDVITVHGTGNPKLMAGGISEALIATKWGLGVAIPMLIAYNLLDLWATRIIGNMEKYAARLVNTLFPVAKRVPEHV